MQVMTQYPQAGAGGRSEVSSSVVQGLARRSQQPSQLIRQCSAAASIPQVREEVE